MKNGRKAAVFVGLAGIAVVLVVLYSTSSPPFSGTDATGAIGAVERHREPQIAAEDVILSDEATHEATQALFADYLEDAATLESIAVDLQAVLRSAEGDLEAAAVSSLQARLRAIDQQLEAHERVVTARALSRATRGVTTMDRMLAARARPGVDVSGLQARIAAVKNDLEARRSLTAADFAGLRASLAALERDFQSTLDARRIETLEAGLDAVRRGLEADETTLEARLQSSELDLQSLDQALEARASLDARHEWGPSVYLSAISKQQNTLQSARRQIAASLDARANKPFAGLAAVGSLVSGEAASLEARALESLNAQIEARQQFEARLRNLDQGLEHIARNLEARPSFSARVPTFRTQLEAARRALSARNQQLGVRMLRQLNAELSVVGTYLDHRSRLSARMAGGVDASALEARNQVLSLRAADAFDSYLAAVHRDLEARSFDALHARSRSTVASRARQLQSHAAMAEARQR